MENFNSKSITTQTIAEISPLLIPLAQTMHDEYETSILDAIIFHYNYRQRTR